ncbi:hypothetical protein AAEX28_04130 [Lentisphaerota bacterium WC36G]|nr:hypothetical protein LJT99_07000 [Lentisphaerae bacterium WC36]
MSEQTQVTNPFEKLINFCEYIKNKRKNLPSHMLLNFNMVAVAYFGETDTLNAIQQISCKKLLFKLILVPNDIIINHFETDEKSQNMFSAWFPAFTDFICSYDNNIDAKEFVKMYNKYEPHLYMCNAQFKEQYNYDVVNQETLDRILSKVDEIIDEAINLETNPQLTSFIFKKAFIMRDAIEKYECTGNYNIKEISHQIIGEICCTCHKFKYDDQASKSIFKKFTNALNLVSATFNCGEHGTKFIETLTNTCIGS